jgi:FixJ family two-component response regulator
VRGANVDQDGESIEGAVVHVADHQCATFERVQHLAEGMGVGVVHHRSHESLLECLDDEQLGCVILELRFPECGGLAVLDQCNQRGIILPTIFLTDHGSIPIAVHALQHGALGFLEKSCRDHDLWETILQAVRTHRARRQWRAKQAGLISLTGSERLVLKRLLEGKSNEATARELRVSVRTVEIRRAKLLKKLAVGSVIELYRQLYWVHPEDLEHPTGEITYRSPDAGWY